MLWLLCNVPIYYGIYIYYDCLLVRPPNKPWFPNTRLILGLKPNMRDTGSKNRG